MTPNNLHDYLFRSRRSMKPLMFSTTVDKKENEQPYNVKAFVRDDIMGLKITDTVANRFTIECVPHNGVAFHPGDSNLMLSPTGSIDSGVESDDYRPPNGLNGSVRCRSMSECSTPLVGILKKRHFGPLRQKTFSEGDSGYQPFSFDEGVFNFSDSCTSSFDDLDDLDKPPKHVTFAERLQSVRTFKSGACILATARRNEKKRQQKKRKAEEKGMKSAGDCAQ